MKDAIVLLAAYNEWMNAKVYAAAAQLPTPDLTANRGAFFGSVLGTLNHIVVGDRIWLHRFAHHPSGRRTLSTMLDFPRPSALNEILFTDFDALTEHRRMLDAVIRRWAESLEQEDLSSTITYANLQGALIHKPLAGLILHFFNHQTHHRGQVTTLLSQFGKDVGATDLLALIKDEPPRSAPGIDHG